MTDDSSITSFFSPPDEEDSFETVNTAYLLDIIIDTEIKPELVFRYLDPEIVPPQDLHLSLDATIRPIFWKASQRAHNTLAYQKFPDSMDISGDMIRLGVAMNYICSVYDGKTQPGVNTHPFTGTAWNIDEKRTEEIAVAVKSQMETAKAVLNKEDVEFPEDIFDAIPLFMAVCYLLLEDFLTNDASINSKT